MELVLDNSFAYEQTRGIEPLQSAFGIEPDSSASGIFKHQIRRCPKGLRYIESRQDAMLIFSEYSEDYFRQTRRKTSILQHSDLTKLMKQARGQSFGGAWSSRDFVLFATGENIPHLRSLFAAFQTLA